MKTSLQKRGGYKPWVHGLSRRRKKLNSGVMLSKKVRVKFFCLLIFVLSSGKYVFIQLHAPVRK